jgi:hypothetical protein
MNTTPDDSLDWRAIAAGAAASIAIGLSVSFLMRTAFAGGMTLGYGTIIALTSFVGLLADAIGGATAGLIAKRRGAVHGALAMVLASAFGLVVSVVMMGRYGQLGMMTSIAYWAQWLGMALLGLGAGTLAGLVAARIAAGVAASKSSS